MRFFRHIVLTAVLSCLALFAASCGSEKSAATPENAAVTFVEYLYTGKGDEAVGMLQIMSSKEVDAATKEMITGKLKAAVIQGQEKAQDRGGIDKIEVVKTEEFAASSRHEAGKTVRVQVIFKDGSTENEKVDLIPVGDAWKVWI